MVDKFCNMISYKITKGTKIPQTTKKNKLNEMEDFNMKTREVVFYSEGAKMVGDIYLPDDYKEGEKRPAVLCTLDGPALISAIRHCLQEL